MSHYYSRPKAAGACLGPIAPGTQFAHLQKDLRGV